MLLEQELIDNPENKTQTAEEILALREKRTQFQIKKSSDRDQAERMKEICEFLKEHSAETTLFDDVLARRIVEKITVNDETLVFEFKSGTEIEV